MAIEHIINRLSASDYNQVFLDLFGYHYPLQLVVVMEEKLSETALDDLNYALWDSPCGKLRKKSQFFAARDYWVPLPKNRIPIVEITHEPIAERDLHNWLNSQVTDEYEVRETAGWKISSVPLEDGGYVVSIIIRHQLIDGIGALRIIDKIASGQNKQLSADTVVSFSDDLRDAKKHAPRVVAALLLQKIFHVVAFIKNRGKISRTFTIAPAVTVLCDTDHLHELVQHKGGSLTTLGFALSANIADAILGSAGNRSILAPMKGEDAGSNSLSVTEINLSSLPFPITDLVGVKAIAKEAYQHGQFTFSKFDISSFYSSIGAFPDTIANIFPKIRYAFGKSPMWTKGAPAVTILPGGTLVSTQYKNCYAFTFTFADIPVERFYPIIMQEFDRLGIVVHKIIR